MLGVTRLIAGGAAPSDGLRYGRQDGAGVKARDIVLRHPPSSAAARKPVVVWNVGRRRNLHCVYCYANSENRSYAGELTTAEALDVLEDLAQFEIPPELPVVSWSV